MTFSGLLLALCALAPSDSMIAVNTLVAWSRVSRDKLRLDSEQPPLILLVDAKCTYTLRPRPDGVFRFGSVRLGSTGVEHGDSISLPGGARIPLGGVAFTSLYDDGKAYFVAALPRVWATDPKYSTDPENWGEFLPLVMLHELTHTRQLAAIARAVAPHAKALGLTAIDDDIVQRRFEADSAFSRMIREEIDLLFSAARVRDDRRRRELVRDWLVLRHARHQRFFSGPDSSYIAIERLFTDMEGVGQWATYVYLRDLAVPRLSPDAALSRARNNRKWWSQEYGLALYLVLDAMMRGWQRQVFPPKLTSAVVLLERAVNPLAPPRR